MDNPITLQEERKVWTIHQSVNGLTYYYNRATKKSQYEMPECFKTTEESLEHPQWKEYRTAEGKKFYYNASTRKSCWQLPNEVKQYRMKLEQKRKKDREENGGKQEENLSEAEEIKRKFMALLRGKSVNINTKWDSCIKLCEDDPRWQLLKTSDKKKYYNEYIGQLKKASEIEKKAKTEVHKGQFIRMLKEAKNINSDCKMHRVALNLMIDPRWRLLEEAQRENTFQNYMDELALKEREEAKEAKLRNSEMFKSVLEEDNVKHNTRWDDVRGTYKQNPYFKELHPYDRISTFVEYILQAERRFEQESVKDKRLRQRSNRVKFRNMLRERLLAGQINYKTKWRTFCSEFREDRNLLNMMDPQQQGSTAHEIFECFMENIREHHKTIKTDIKHHFKRKGFKMTEQVSNSEFKAKTADLPVFTQLKDFVQDYFHIYFQQKIKAKNQNKQVSARKLVRKQRKLIFKIFKQLKDNLKTKYSIQDHMQRIEKGMKERGITISHQSIFKYYLAFLEGYEDKKNDHSRSNSNSSNSPKKVKEGKESETYGKKQEIPGQNDIEEEGEIKDDQIKDEEISSERDKKKKKEKISRKRKRSSSSDSD